MIRIIVGCALVPEVIGTAVLAVGMTYCWLAVGGSCGRKLVWFWCISLFVITMALTIDNKMKRGVSMEALMSIPGKKDVFKTSILPVKAGKSGLESWPHPISQLVLGNLQLTPEEGAQPKK